MESLANVWGIFCELLRGYFRHGWPFFIGHVVIVGFILVDTWRRIRRETNALERWDPEDKYDDGSEATETISILSRFVEESEAIGAHGAFVPMTDFSDRLDSIVDGMISELHDRTNHLLLVGIAGTLFGVFEFAFGAQGQGVQELGELLSRSMSKAFPVGFMGLVLTVFFQIWAAFPERSLREALAQATDKALHRRKEVSRSQAQIVQQSVERIEQAMEPLRDLEATLTQTIQPVVEKFGERLDQSLELVRVQFDQLRGATGSVHKAVEAVNAGVTSLSEAARNLEGLLRDAPVVLEDLSRLYDEQRLLLQHFDAGLGEQVKQARRAIKALTAAAAELGQLPEKIFSETEQVLSRLTEQSLAAWQDVLAKFELKLYTDYSKVLEEIRSETQAAAHSLDAASQQWEQVAQSLQELPDKMISKINDTFAQLSEESLRAWKEATDKLGRDLQREYINYIQYLHDEVGKLRESLDGVAGECDRIVRNMEGLLREPIQQTIRAAKEELSETLRTLDRTLAERYPQVTNDIKIFTDELKGLLTKLDEIAVNLNGCLGAAQQAHSTIGEINGTLAATLRQLREASLSGDAHGMLPLLEDQVRQLESLNQALDHIRTQLPLAGDGIDVRLRESIEILGEIREGVNEIRQKKKRFGLF